MSGTEIRAEAKNVSMFQVSPFIWRSSFPCGMGVGDIVVSLWRPLLLDFVPRSTHCSCAATRYPEATVPKYTSGLHTICSVDPSRIHVVDDYFVLRYQRPSYGS